MESSAKMTQKVVKGRKMIIVMKTRAGVEYNEESDADKDNGERYEDIPADEENEDNGEDEENEDSGEYKEIKANIEEYDKG